MESNEKMYKEIWEYLRLNIQPVKKSYRVMVEIPLLVRNYYRDPVKKIYRLLI